MLYNPPTGGAANDPYVSANIAAGIQGSKVPPNAIEYPQREIVALITAAGLAPTNADLQQVLRSVRSGILEYYVDTGAPSAAVIAPTPAHTALVDGLHVRVRMANPAIGPTTLSINALVAPVQRPGPASAAGGVGGLALAGGEWATNDVVDLVYNAARAAFQIMGVTVPATALWHVAIDSSKSAATITATASPAVPTRIPDLAYLVIPANACAGATQINVGFGLAPLTRNDASPLQSSDYAVGQPLLVVDDGTNFRVVTSVPSQASASTASYVDSYVSNNYAKGSLIAQRVFATPGSQTYTPTPGTNRVRVTVQGAGGYGGATQASGSGQYYAAGGGGAGGEAVADIASGFAGITITVGGGSTTPAVPGGTSSFGSICSATGGGSPGVAAPGTIAQVQTGGAGGIGSGGNVSNGVGESGGLGVALTSGNLVSGFGAPTAFGSGGNTVYSSSTPGQGASSYGAGGSGACVTGNAPAQPGGAGAGGVVIVEEYA